MARIAFTDDSMMMLLRVVVATSEGNEAYTQPPEPEPALCDMEVAGLLWLLPRGPRYLIRPTEDGVRFARYWTRRQAKEAARRIAG